MELTSLYRYRRHHNWSTADYIAFICAIIVIYAIRKFAKKYFPNIRESILNIISTIVIVIAVLIANTFK